MGTGNGRITMEESIRRMMRDQGYRARCVVSIDRTISEDYDLKNVADSRVLYNVLFDSLSERPQIFYHYQDTESGSCLRSMLAAVVYRRYYS